MLLCYCSIDFFTWNDAFVFKYIDHFYSVFIVIDNVIIIRDIIRAVQFLSFFFFFP